MIPVFACEIRNSAGQVVRGELVAEDRAAEEEVDEAPVRDAQHGVVADGEPLLHAVDPRQDRVEGLRARACEVALRGRHPRDRAGVAVLRRGRVVRVGLAHLVHVRVGLERQPQDLADGRRRLLRAAVVRGEDRLDPLVAQPLPHPARLLPAARRQAVGVLGPTLELAVGDVRHRLAVAREEDHAATSRRNSSCTRSSPAISGWNEITSMLSWRAATGCPSTVGQDLDRVAVLGQPRRADEDGADRRTVDPRDLEVLLERADLAAERVAHRTACPSARGARGRA